MPGFDGTGPQSRGPMTGGGRGFCAIPREEFDKGAFRRFEGRPLGLGRGPLRMRGRGFGRGLRNRWGWRDKGF